MRGPRLLKKTVEALGVAGLAALILVTLSAVGSRYLLNAPLAWGEEVQMTLMIWAVMLGGVVAAWDRSALAIDLFPLLWGERGRRRLDWVSRLITALTMCPLVYYGWRLYKISRTKLTNILHLPHSWLVLAVVVGALGIGLVSLAQMIRPPAGGREQ